MEPAAPRWNHLFDDLESQLEHELAAEELDLRGEEERLRLGRLTLRSRLVALAASAPDAALTVHSRSGGLLRIVPSTIGRDWVGGRLVEESRHPRDCVLPLWSVAGLSLDAAQVRASIAEAAYEEPTLAARLGIAFVLRDLCRRRQGVDIRVGEDLHHGTIDRVGRDHLDLALHGSDAPRRESAVTGYRVLPFERIDLVTLKGRRPASVATAEAVLLQARVLGLVPQRHAP